MIREAITKNALVFIACFSTRSVARKKSYQNEELTLAIQQLRLFQPDVPWLIPVRFDDCDIPDLDLGAGRTLASIQRADLFGERRDAGIARLVMTILRILGTPFDSDLPVATTIGRPDIADRPPAEPSPAQAVAIPAPRSVSAGRHKQPKRLPFGPVTLPGIKTVYAVAFSPDGALLATSGLATQMTSKRLPAGSTSWYPVLIQLWDTQTRQLQGSISDAFTDSNGDNCLVSAMAFSPDGALLAAGSSEGTIHLWSPRALRQLGDPLNTHTDGYVSAVAFSPDGTLLATLGSGVAWLWNVRTRQPEGDPITGTAAAAFSPDGALLATGDDRGRVHLWDLRTREPQGGPLGGPPDVPADPEDPFRDRFTDEPTAPTACGVTFSPDSIHLAAGYSDGKVQLWNTRTRQPEGDPLDAGHIPIGPYGNAPDCTFFPAAFSPDGTLLAIGDVYNTVRLWDTRTRHPQGDPMLGLRSDKYDSEAVCAVAFSPDGTLLATGSYATAEIWHLG